MATEAPEVVEVTDYRVACDGKGEHPRVWLQIPREQGWVECPYCDAKYVIRDSAGSGH